MVYIIDQTHRGRSPHLPLSGVGQTGGALLGIYSTSVIEKRFTATKKHMLWPQAQYHTQWEGVRCPESPPSVVITPCPCLCHYESDTLDISQTSKFTDGTLRYRLEKEMTQRLTLTTPPSFQPLSPESSNNQPCKLLEQPSSI